MSLRKGSLLGFEIYIVYKRGEGYIPKKAMDWKPDRQRRRRPALTCRRTVEKDLMTAGKVRFSAKRL